MVNQITRNLPFAELLIRNVLVPLTSLAEATLVIELRFAELRAAEVPTSNSTSPPGAAVPKVTETER